jgi:hypothetical protein
MKMSIAQAALNSGMSANPLLPVAIFRKGASKAIEMAQSQ